MYTCMQCGKPAVVKYPFGYLCIGCNLKYQQANDIQFAALERSINFHMDRIDEVFGIRSGGRFPERKPIMVNNNSISIDRSIIGSVNTGTINKLDVNMNALDQDNALEIKKFTERVLKDKSLDKESKDKILEHLDYLTGEATKSKVDRNLTVVSTVIQAVSALITTIPTLVQHWNSISSFFVK